MYLYVETIIRFSLALAIVCFAYKILLNKRFFLISILAFVSYYIP